jgi:DNA-binding transcriptional MerR regulator
LLSIMHEEQITVTELAERTGLAVSAVRYYERAGLLPPPWRHGRAIRYPASAVDRINSVRHAQAAGLSLSEIRELSVLGELLQLRQ